MPRLCRSELTDQVVETDDQLRVVRLHKRIELRPDRRQRRIAPVVIPAIERVPVVRAENLLRQYRPTVLVPFAWDDSYYRILDVGFETALGEFTATVKDGWFSGPVITAQPANLTVGAGANGSFSVTATGTLPLTYQWQLSVDAGASWTNLPTTPSPYSGITANALTITTAIKALSGVQYRCLVTNSGGTTTSDEATLTVTAPTGVRVNRYRLYSPVTLEHLYTTDFHEYTVLGTWYPTWQQEGLASQLHNGPVTVSGVAAVPYYRLYDFVSR